MAKVARRFSVASAYQRLNVIDEQPESSQSDARSRSRSGSMFSRSRRSSIAANAEAAARAAAGTGAASSPNSTRKSPRAPLYRLQDIMDTPNLLGKFRDFLNAEHCGENLLFLEAVVEYNDIVRDVKRRKHDKYARCRCRRRVLQKAHQVFDEFLSPAMSKAPLGVAGRSLRAVEATLDAHSLKLRYDFVKELQKQAQLHSENRCQEAKSMSAAHQPAPRPRPARPKTSRFVSNRRNNVVRSMTLNPSRSRALSPLARVSTLGRNNPRSPRPTTKKASTLTRRTSQSLIRMFTGGGGGGGSGSGSGGGGGWSDDSDGGNEQKKKRRGRRKSKGEVYVVPEDANNTPKRRFKSRSRSRSRSRPRADSDGTAAARQRRKKRPGSGGSGGGGTFSSFAAVLSPRSRRKASLASQPMNALTESAIREETESLTARCECGDRFDLDARVKAANACSTSQLIGNTEHDPKLRCSMTRRKSAPFARSYVMPPQISEEESKGGGDFDLIPVAPGASAEHEFGFSLHEILAVTRGSSGQKKPLLSAAAAAAAGSDETKEAKKDGNHRGGFSSALSSPRKSNAGFLVPKRPSISQSGGKSGHKLSPASGGGGRTPAAAAGASGGGYDILDVKDFDWLKYNELGLLFVREDTSGDDFRDQPEIFKYEYYARERQDVLLKRHLLHEHNIVTEDLSKLPQSPACVAFNSFSADSSSYDKTPMSLPSPRAVVLTRAVSSPSPAPVVADEDAARSDSTTTAAAGLGLLGASDSAHAKHSRSASRTSTGSGGASHHVGQDHNFSAVSWQLADLFGDVYAEVYQLLSSEKLARFNMQNY